MDFIEKGIEKITNHALLVGMEWGYKAHEKGLNYQEALINFNKIIKRL